MRPFRPFLSLALLCAAAASLTAQGAPSSDPLQRLLRAEDARGTGADGIVPLREALTGRDTLLRRLAVRGMGRFQRSEFIPDLLPLLGDPVPAVRREAANALAQSLRRARRTFAPGDSSHAAVITVLGALERAMGTERHPAVLDGLAESIGRLPLGDTLESRRAEVAILRVTGTTPRYPATYGLYKLAAAKRASGGLTGSAVALLRTAVRTNPDSAVRRVAALALGVQGGFDSATTAHAIADPDAQVRRLGLAGLPTLAAGARLAAVEAALRDPSPIVRVEGVHALRTTNPVPDCAPLLVAARDATPYVALIAIDSLSLPCLEPAAVATTLAAIITAPRTGRPEHAWQAPAHALVALARVDRTRAAALLPAFAKASRAEERTYAARAATALGDAAMLRALAIDTDANVREAVFAGLSQLTKHESDDLYIAGLRGSGYQAVLAAAQALAGSTRRDAVPTLFASLEAITADRKETSRDPRIMILRRLGELGDAQSADRLRPYASDFDTTVAATAAALLTKWGGAPVQATPRPLPIRDEPLATVFRQDVHRLRVTLAPESGGGSFTLLLHGADAPATVARLLRLAREGFYDGHVFQRVEPNFVIQGGGPGASEYIGDGPFMRDELSYLGNRRGTLGISARGRDTGDAQWYFNVVDNPLLDHEYTIAGRVERGGATMEAIMEGDRIAKVEVLDR